MRVVVAGSGSWATDVAEACSEAYEIRVVTCKDEAHLVTGDAFGPQLSTWATKRGITHHQDTAPPTYPQEIWAAGGDVLVTSNWRHRVPPHILREFPFGGVNIHRGALPQFAGFSPINWAIALGATSTAVTAHTMTEVLDAGLLLCEERIDIGPDDTATDLYLRTRQVAPRVAVKAIAFATTPHREPLRSLPRPAFLRPFRAPNSLLLDWSLSADEVYNAVRAQSPPFPTSYFRLAGQRIHVMSARRSALSPKSAHPGTVLAVVNSGGVVVACGVGSVELHKLQKASHGEEIASTTILSPGMKLTVASDATQGDGSSGTP